MQRITIALVLILGLTWLQSSNAEFAQDVDDTYAKITRALCTKTIPADKIKNFAKCSSNPVEILNCRQRIYKYNFDSSANVAKTCKTDSNADVQYFQCLEAALKKKFADPNVPIRQSQKCEIAALGI